jgi:hypothetical protein
MRREDSREQCRTMWNGIFSRGDMGGADTASAEPEEATDSGEPAEDEQFVSTLGSFSQVYKLDYAP